MNQTGSDAEWLWSGTGRSPELRWSFSTEAALVDLALARETGEILAGDASGGIYLLDRRGRLEMVMRGFPNLAGLAFCDSGTAAAVVVDEAKVYRLDRRLEVQWAAELPDAVLCVALDPFGEHIAASLANGTTYIFDSQKETVGRFETERPLCVLCFLVTRPVLLGAAEYGLLCSHRLDGSPNWNEQLWSNVGDISATGDGEHVFLASYSHGVQAYDREGCHRGSYVVEGTPNHVSTSFTPRRLAVTTSERHFYWIDAGGEMLWAGSIPDDAVRVRCDPLGTGAVCGLAGERIVSIGWS
jgi:hypothetical protein